MHEMHTHSSFGHRNINYLPILSMAIDYSIVRYILVQHIELNKSALSVAKPTCF